MTTELIIANIKVGALLFRNNGYACYILDIVGNNNFIFISNSWRDKLVYGVIKSGTLNDDLSSDSDKSDEYRITAILENPSPDFIAYALKTKFDNAQEFIKASEKLAMDNTNAYSDDRSHLVKGNLFLDRNGGVHIIIGLHKNILHTINSNLRANALDLESFHPNLYSKSNMRLGIKCVFKGIGAIHMLFDSALQRITNRTIDNSGFKQYIVYDNRTQKDLGLLSKHQNT